MCRDIEVSLTFLKDIIGGTIIMVDFKNNITLILHDLFGHF